MKKKKHYYEILTNKSFIKTLCGMLLFNVSIAQTQKATTEKGEKVVLFSDGTWKYEESIAKNTIILDPNDCTNWIKTEEDKVSGDKYVTIKEGIIVSDDGGKKGFGISLMLAGKNTIIFSINVVGAGSCIDKGSKINLLFTDGARMTLASDGSFNCKGNATIYFGGIWGKKNLMNELMNRKIDVMRVWTSDSFVEQKFEDSQAEYFKNTMNCLSKN